MYIIKKIKYLLSRYQSFKQNPLTKHNPFLYFIKFIYINFLLYVFSKEVKFTFLNNIKVAAKKGDGIIGNYHSVLQEPKDSIFLLHFLRNTSTFVDIGANVGHYTLLASIISKSNVISIEPVYNTFQRLKNNLKLNNIEKNVELLNIGLSDKPGKLFFSDKLFTTNKVSLNNKGTEITVNVLDNICKNKEIEIIKIDVEGYKWFVLNGAKEILKSDAMKVIIIELNDSGLNFGINDSQIITFLNDLGYKQYEYNIFNRDLKIINYKNNTQFNTLFIKDVDYVIDRVKNAENIKFSNFNL